MKITPEIFKAYDIRGIYPTEINIEVAYLIGKAFVGLLREKYKTPQLNIVCGRDARLSSKELSLSLISGMSDEGAEIDDVGMVSTDMIYFATGFYKRGGGVMVTASHNPKEYNGFKFCGRDAEGITGENGVYEIRDLVMKNDVSYMSSRARPTGRVEGSRTSTNQNILPDYVKHVLSFIDAPKIKNLKIVIDAGNGVGGLIFGEIAKKLPINLIPLYFEPDGNFPNRDPNPLKEGALQKLQETVIREKCDLGIAFDGDADRAVFVSEKREIMSGTLIGSLVAAKFLKEFPRAKVIYSLNCGRIVEEIIKSNNGQAIISPVGHSNIKQLMRKENAILGIEHSGHYYFQKHYYADSAMIASLMILEIISEKGSLDDLLTPLKKYFHSGEINLKTEKGEEKIKVVREKYKDGKILEIDGLRVDYPNWWFLLRPSNTEPLLRLTVEADSQELLEEKKKEILSVILSGA